MRGNHPERISGTQACAAARRRSLPAARVGGPSIPGPSIRGPLIGPCPSATTPSPVALAEVPTGAPSPCVPPRGSWRTPAAAPVKRRSRSLARRRTAERPSYRTNRPHRYPRCGHPAQVFVCNPGVECVLIQAAHPFELMPAKVGRRCDGTLDCRADPSHHPAIAAAATLPSALRRSNDSSMAAHCVFARTHTPRKAAK
jgi:hypothetical protein